MVLHDGLIAVWAVCFDVFVSPVLGTGCYFGYMCLLCFCSICLLLHSWNKIPGACIHFCEICLSAPVCMRANVCALHPLCSQQFLFNSIQTVRVVERLESAGRQQSFGTSVIRGPWKCTHSLAQLAPKEVPAWQISTKNVSRWFSTHTMSPCKLACILWKEQAHCYE